MKQHTLVVDEEFIQGLVPVAHHILTLEAQVLVRKRRPQGTRYAAGDVRSMRWNYWSVKAEDRRDGARKLVPRGLALAGDVVGPDGAALDEEHRLLDDLRSTGGTHDLIVRESKGRARLRSPHNRRHGAVAVCAVDVGDAQDQAVGICTPDGLFAHELGASVPVEWVGRVPFRIGVIRSAIEDVIGADVYDLRRYLAGGMSHVTRTEDIDAVRLVTFLLARVDAGLGGTVDDHGRLEFQHRALDRQAIGDIALRMRQTDQIIQQGEPIHELPAQTPAGTHHEDGHDLNVSPREMHRSHRKNRLGGTLPADPN